MEKMEANEGQSLVLVPESPQSFKAAKSLESVPNHYRTEEPFKVNITTHEFTACCPATGMPDAYTLEIMYIPRDLILELKSLKLYTHCFRNIGIMVEPVANKIADDLVEAVNPFYCAIKVYHGVRGGFSTLVEVKRGTIPDSDSSPAAIPDGYETME